MAVTVKIENHYGQTLALPQQEWVVGTATPMGPRDDGSVVGVVWYNGAKIAKDVGVADFKAKGFLGFSSGPAPSEYRGGESNVIWVALHNQFFALAVMPPQPAESLVVQKVP